MDWKSKVKKVMDSQHLLMLIKHKVRALSRPYMLNSIPKNFLEAFDEEEFYVNPTGNFVLGGPDGDCGLTGRKIIVDIITMHHKLVEHFIKDLRKVRLSNYFKIYSIKMRCI